MALKPLMMVICAIGMEELILLYNYEICVFIKYRKEVNYEIFR